MRAPSYRSPPKLRAVAIKPVNSPGRPQGADCQPDFRVAQSPSGGASRPCRTSCYGSSANSRVIRLRWPDTAAAFQSTSSTFRCVCGRQRFPADAGYAPPSERANSTRFQHSSMSRRYRTTCSTSSSGECSALLSRISGLFGGSYAESMPVKFGSFPARAL